MLSNLLWWPWHGLGVEAPVVAGYPWTGGDRRVRHEVIRTHPPSEDEEALIATILAHS